MKRLIEEVGGEGRRIRRQYEEKRTQLAAEETNRLRSLAERQLGTYWQVVRFHYQVLRQLTDLFELCADVFSLLFETLFFFLTHRRFRITTWLYRGEDTAWERIASSQDFFADCAVSVEFGTVFFSRQFYSFYAADSPVKREDRHSLDMYVAARLVMWQRRQIPWPDFNAMRPHELTKKMAATFLERPFELPICVQILFGQESRKPRSSLFCPGYL